MPMLNKTKLILSKIKIAQLKQKKVLEHKNTSFDLLILDILWKNSYIYGYVKKSSIILIFLRYNLSGVGVLEKIQILNTKLKIKQAKALILLDPYYNYLLLCNNKITIHSISNPVNSGAILIAKL